MAAEIQSLIEKIKQDGIHEAQRRSQDIVAEAEKKAAEIVGKAEQEASRIIADAKRQASSLEENARMALSHARRDLIISLRRQVTDHIEAILKDATTDVLHSEKLVDIIEKVIEKWNQSQNHSNKDMDILVSDEDYLALQNGLLAKMREELPHGIVFKPAQHIDAGFKIGEKDGHMFYDFSDQAIVEVLSYFLNPRISRIFDEIDAKEP